MAKCKTCGREYHACGSCGLADYEYDFCNDKCLEVAKEKAYKELSEKYNITIEVLKEIFNEDCVWQSYLP